MQNHNISLVGSSAGAYQASLVVGALTSRGLSSQERVCDTCHCILQKYKILRLWTPNNSGAASSISGGAIFIYSCSGQLSSFEIKLISKELS